MNRYFDTPFSIVANRPYFVVAKYEHTNTDWTWNTSLVQNTETLTLSVDNSVIGSLVEPILPLNYAYDWGVDNVYAGSTKAWYGGGGCLIDNIGLSYTPPSQFISNVSQTTVSTATSQQTTTQTTQITATQTVPTQVTQTITRTTPYSSTITQIASATITQTIYSQTTVTVVAAGGQTPSIWYAIQGVGVVCLIAGGYSGYVGRAKPKRQT